MDLNLNFFLNLVKFHDGVKTPENQTYGKTVMMEIIAAMWASFVISIMEMFSG